MDNTPDIGSPEWRLWIMGRLAEIVRGHPVDSDVAAIVGRNGSLTRTKIDEMITANDVELKASIAAAVEAQLDGVQSEAHRYADTRDTLTLAEAKKYTDDHSGGGGVSANYVDAGDAKALADAKLAITAAVSNSSSTLRQYTDSAAAKALTDAKASAGAADTEILRLAKVYTDSKPAGGGGVTETQLNNAVAQGVEDAGTAATLADDALSAELRTYTNQAVSGSLGDAAAEAQRLATAAGAAAVATANDYTDNSADVVATNVLAAVDAKIVESVNVKSFGALGNGVDDDTASIQAFVNHITSNGVRGHIPAGTYIISAKISFPRVPGWEIVGAGRYSTKIVQKTNNTPIFEIGGNGNSTMHSWGIDGITFDYQNLQPATNVNSTCLLFADKDQGANEGYITNCTFAGGYWAIQTGVGCATPWGNYWNNLIFGGGLSGGAIDFTNGTLGVPANSFGRMYATGSRMTAPYVFQMSGDCQTIDSIEVNNLENGNGLLLLTAASDTTIGSIRVENGNFIKSQALVALNNRSSADIGAMKVGGNRFPVAANAIINLIQVDDGYAVVRLAQISTPEPTTNGMLRVAKTTGNGFVEIGMVYLQTLAARIVDNGSSDSTIKVKQMSTGRVSNNLGDVDYAVKTNDANTLVFNTAFTTPRVITLPSVNDNLYSGLYYEFKFDGAINGANTATIKANSNIRIQNVDHVIVGFTYRRHPFDPSQGWVLTKYDQIA